MNICWPSLDLRLKVFQLPPLPSAPYCAPITLPSSCYFPPCWYVYLMPSSVCIQLANEGCLEPLKCQLSSCSNDIITFESPFDFPLDCPRPQLPASPAASPRSARQCLHYFLILDEGGPPATPARSSTTPYL